MNGKQLAVCLFAVAVLCFCMPTAAGPLHASCKVTWTFPNTSCGIVNGALVKAVANLSGSDCGTSEKCLYSLVSASSSEIKVVHTTPVKHYADDVSFDFSQSGTDCVVAGYSTSETWYAILDYGTNYCNMHNLGAILGLQYSEITSDDICTQYSSANCDKY
eukprot:TRINITY_DN5465_c0_g1_i1.p1 TRINITY_DN5465_c0_g1~~TRINITY_DN5465_c0_g1_i1.p1  ORF type:complete len:161 (-),score=43.99 TRINITY_DN5465_c0_g1_i1:51-533(-)